jgi:uncharacterized membrane protein YhfC
MDIAVRLVNSLIMLALPLLLAAWLVRRYGLPWRLFLIGAGTFIGSQLVHIPFNRFILQPFAERLGLQGAETGLPLVLLAILFGLSAGLFEETARYIVYRVWLGDERRWKGGLLFGLGHGGMEAMLLGGLSFYVLMQTIAYRNADLTTIVPAEQLALARAQLDAYWSAPWYAALLGALERMFAIGIQVSLAVMVLQAFTRRNVVWLLLAILWHAIIDAVAVYGASTWGIYLTELAIALMAGLSVLFLFRMRHDEVEPDPVDLGPPGSLPEGRIDPEMVIEHLPKDRLDDSRFDRG